MLPEYFVYIGVALQFLGALSYVRATVKGETKPNRITWFLWAAIPMIAVAASLDEGVGTQVWLTFIAGFNPLMIFLASFVNKKAYWKLRNFDYVLGMLAVLGVVLWQITGNGLLAIGFSILADFLAGVPTLVKSFKEPETENPTVFGMCVIASLLTMLTIDTFDFATTAFPLYLLLMCLTLFVLIRFKAGPRLKVTSTNKPI